MHAALRFSGIVIMAMGLMIATTLQAESQCRPSLLGSPCQAAGITILPDPTQPARGLGNPVDSRSGNRHLREVDTVSDWPQGLFVRFHNSRDRRGNPLGGGWAWSWDTRLHVVGERRQIVQADGSRWIFEAPDAQGRCGAPSHHAGELVRHADGTHAWRWPNGHTLRFDPQGLLVQIQAPSQSPVDIRRSGADPIKGLALSLHWQGRQVVLEHEQLHGKPVRLARLHGDGVSITLQHDWPAGGPWRLLEVRDASGQIRRYDHDPRLQGGQPHAITARHWQLAPWTLDWVTHRMHYDRLGRVTLSEWGGPHHYRRVALRYASPESVAAVPPICPGCLDTRKRRQAWAVQQGLPAHVLEVPPAWPSSWMPATPDQEQRDSLGRLRERRWGSARTQWEWASHGLARVADAQEQETRLAPDAHGWWHRHIRRPHPSGQPLRWRESRRFDAGGRLIEERLPEGGELSYRHDVQGRLQSIHYRDDTPRWQQLWPVNAAVTVTEPARRTDSLGRLSIQAIPGQTADWYAWNEDGRLRAAQVTGRPVRPLDRQANGRVQRLRGWAFQYDARGRLIEARAGRRSILFTHNDWGQTIRRVGVPNGTLQDFIYSGFRRVGELRWGPQGHRLMRRTVWAGQIVVAVLDYPGGRALIADPNSGTDRQGVAARITHLHTTPQGLPVAASDQQGRLLWQARAHAFGRLHTQQRAPGFQPPTQRFPGQNEDPDTGLHDHLLRVYSPEHGEFLQPDPMGPTPLVHPFAYAAHQPHRFADPWGDLLFAFDGTRNNQRTGTHVFELSALYQAEPGFVGPAAHYFAGPGVRSLPVALDPLSWAPIEVDAILSRAWASLLDSLARQPASAKPIPIDIIGFSRGAAMGRAFAHRLASESTGGRLMAPRPGGGLIDACLDLRFMGLFDTVAQFGVAGSGNGRHPLDIDPVWNRIAHAVAHHEERAMFPLHSLVGSDVPGVIEQGFAGNHIDIGGGYQTEQEGHGDLDDASLAWMWRQGQLEGLNWRALPQDRQTVTEGLLHDERDAWQRSLGNPRPVFDAFGHPLSWAQRTLAAEHWPALSAAEEQLLTDMTRPWRHPDIDIVVGRIDEQAYGRWLASLPVADGASR